MHYHSSFMRHYTPVIFSLSCFKLIIFRKTISALRSIEDLVRDGHDIEYTYVYLGIWCTKMRCTYLLTTYANHIVNHANAVVYSN